MKATTRFAAVVLTVIMLVSALSVITFAAPIRYELTADMIKSANAYNTYVMENIDGKTVDGKFIYDYARQAYVELELTNDNYVMGWNGKVYYNNIPVPYTFTDDQATNPWSLGENQATLSILGKEFPITVMVIEGYTGDDDALTENGFAYRTADDHAIVTGCTLKQEIITIPETLGDLPVTRVENLNDAVLYAKKVVFPDSVTTIEGYVFSTDHGKVVTEEIVIGSGVASLESISFDYFNSLKAITVSEENEFMTSVDGVVFNKDVTTMLVYPKGKTGTYTLPKTVNTLMGIADYVDFTIPTDTEGFEYKDGMFFTNFGFELVFVPDTVTGNVTVPDGTTHIGNKAFMGRTDITSVTLPDSVTDIMYASFLDCSALTSVNVPTSLNAIGNSAFQNTAISSFTLPEGITTIGEYAFAKTPLKSVVFPDSVTLVDDHAYSSTDITSVNLVNAEFGRYVFSNSKVTSFTADSDVTAIPYAMFRATPMTALKVPASVTTVYGYAFADTQIKTLDLSNVTAIYYNAFTNTKIESLVIPDSVTTMSEAFTNCDSLKSIKLGKGINVINETFMYCDALESVTIPATVTYISSGFAYCKNLKKVKFEGPVTLMESAFYGCDMSEADLKNVTGAIGRKALGNLSAVGLDIPDTVTELTYASFINSQSLAYVGIPKSVNGIHPYAFDGCDSLDHVFYGGSEAEWKALASGRDDDVLSHVTVHYNTATKVEKKSVAATCTTSAGVEYKCTICNEVIATTVKETAASHSFGEYVYDNNATTQKDGTKTAKCTKCPATDTKAAPGTKLKMQDSTKVFTDVVDNKWYTNAVDYAYSNGFISGMTEDSFGLDTQLTRGMFITILARIAGVDTSAEANKAAKTKFTDVESGRFYAAAIAWGFENKVVSGMSETTFEPNTYITREQLCVMIVNFSKVTGTALTPVESEMVFADASNIASWAKDAVKTCQMADIVNGYTDGTFGPKKTATRAEAAQILYVFHMEYISLDE